MTDILQFSSDQSFYDEIPPRILEWIPKQKLFFVATAALRSKKGQRIPDNRRNVAGRRVDEWGFVNASPKEMGLFNVVNARNVWCEWEVEPSRVLELTTYSVDQDLTGSGGYITCVIQTNAETRYVYI